MTGVKLNWASPVFGIVTSKTVIHVTQVKHPEVYVIGQLSQRFAAHVDYCTPYKGTLSTVQPISILGGARVMNTIVATTEICTLTPNLLWEHANLISNSKLPW